MKVFFLSFLFLIILHVFPRQSQAQVPLDTLVSLLTCDPGSDLYSIFGHSAVRVKIGENDIIFNYGTFDFKQKGFYPKFLRGKLLYRLAAAPYEAFIMEYHYEKRGMREQIFNLYGDEKKKFVDFLFNNAQPENRSYKYDFFYDNCATRIRDLVEKTQTNVKFPTYSDSIQLSFRDILHQYLSGSPWSKYGIDLIIGSRADKQATVKDQMYIPDYLQDHLGNTMVANKPLTYQINEVLLFEEERKARLTPHPFGPNLVYIILGILLAGLSFFGRERVTQKLLNIIYLLLGMAGLIIVFLWFFTDHLATRDNFNLLWINPLILLILFKKFNYRKSLIYIFLGLTLFCIVGMLAGIIPQSHPSIYMGMTIALAYLIQLNLLRKNKEVPSMD